MKKNSVNTLKTTSRASSYDENMSQSANSFQNLYIEKSNKSSVVNEKKTKNHNETPTLDKSSISYENSKTKNES